MKTIEKIVIKSESGFTSFDNAYDDKLTIIKNSIKYEYKKAMSIDGSYQWKYKCESESFAKTFDEVGNILLQQVRKKQDQFYMDGGKIYFTFTFSDKSKESYDFSVLQDYFYEPFKLIEKLIPACEEIPIVINTEYGSYDEDDDLY